MFRDLNRAAARISTTMQRSEHQSGTTVVHGASRGIGLAITRMLLGEHDSAAVIATCRDPGTATQLAQLQTEYRQRLTVLALDVTDEPSISAAARQASACCECVTTMINCVGLLHDAGHAPERRLADIDPNALLRSFSINAIGPLLTAKHFLPLFDRRARGVIASLSARVGSIADNRLGGWYGYRASKAAQNMFTRNLAIELQRRHRAMICVALHPGTVDTDLSRPFQARVPDGKLFDVERAATQLLTIINGLGPKDNGRFIAWDGREIPW